MDNSSVIDWVPRVATLKNVVNANNIGTYFILVHVNIFIVLRALQNQLLILFPS